jgi:ABC-type proline/glycine betaine transport system substrate-binding protein
MSVALARPYWTIPDGQPGQTILNVYVAGVGAVGGALLEQIEFTMEEVSEILAAMQEGDLDPDEGAEWFLRERTDKWHAWVSDDVIESVEAALN